MLSLRILLVEGDPTIAQHIRYVLEQAGHQVLPGEGQDVQGLYTQFRPDLVILNFQQQCLPDGMALARSLRHGCSPHILLLTGARPADLRKSEDYNAHLPVLYKPFTRRQLYHAVNALTGTAEARFFLP